MSKRVSVPGAVLCVLLLFAAAAAAEPMNSMDVVRTLLNDPQVIFWEDAGMMEGSDGQYFGGIAEKRISDNGEFYEFLSDDSGAHMVSQYSFLDAGNYRGNAQAILFKFNSDHPEDLIFMLDGNGEITLSFDAEGRPVFTHKQDGYSAPYDQYRDTTLTVQPGSTYWALMAFDSHGYYRSLVWATDNTDDVAYCGENIGDWHGDYAGANWHLTIMFGPNQTLQIQEYSVMDFDSIAGMDEPQGDSDGGADLTDPMNVINAMVNQPEIRYADD